MVSMIYEEIFQPKRMGAFESCCILLKLFIIIITYILIAIATINYVLSTKKIFTTQIITMV